ncbi:hypothetical protein HY837_00345 [archaeon]|nr:hypothetical protein [archaeon]
MLATNDNSPTLFNEKFQEAYHSTTGAITEAIEKFVKPSLNLLRKKELNVLDFCFGLGYNTAALLQSVENTKISVIGLENDADIFEKIQQLNPDLKYYEYIKKLKNNYHVKKDFFEIKIILGDARDTVKTLQEKFDFVFFDPFSTKKCPELWTEEVFRDVFKIMSEKSILTTYTCSRFVRENMRNAGFHVIDGPCVGRKSPSTICIKE